MSDNCDLHADCTNNYGSFLCECQINFQWWGTGINDQCFECYECELGEYMRDDCTSTADRFCKLSIPDGNYALQTESDTVQQCLVHWKEKGKIFPERYSWGGRTFTQTETSSPEATKPFEIGRASCRERV